MLKSVKTLISLTTVGALLLISACSETSELSPSSQNPPLDFKPDSSNIPVEIYVTAELEVLVRLDEDGASYEKSSSFSAVESVKSLSGSKEALISIHNSIPNLYSSELIDLLLFEGFGPINLIKHDNDVSPLEIQSQYSYPYSPNEKRTSTLETPLSKEPPFDLPKEEAEQLKYSQNI